MSNCLQLKCRECEAKCIMHALREVRREIKELHADVKLLLEEDA